MLEFIKKMHLDLLRNGETILKDQIVQQSNCSTGVIPQELDALDASLFEEGTGSEELRSRLAKSLQDVLSDEICLSYFTQFLDKKEALQFLKFYLDCESLLMTGNFQTIRRSKHCNEILNKKFNTEHGRLKQKIQTKLSRSISLDECNSLHSNINGGYLKLSKSVENNLFNVHLLDSFESVSNEIVIQHNRDLDANVENFSNSLVKTLATKAKKKIPTNDKFFNKSESRKTTNCVTDKICASDISHIYKKYFAQTSPDFISVPSTILMNISFAFCTHLNDLRTCSTILLNCLIEAKKYVLNELQMKYLNDFLKSSFYCQYCIYIMNSSSFSVADILHSESALFYFTEYLEQQSKSFYLQFWIAASNFQKHYKSHFDHSFSKNEAQNDAMILYDKYFSLQARCPLNISDHVRSCIEDCICANNEAVIYCFDLPLRIIEGYLSKYHFKGFLSSPLFDKYLRELNVRMYENVDQFVFPTYTLSTQGEESVTNLTFSNKKYIRKAITSQQKPFLAVKSKEASSPDNDIQIDSKHLTNPDLLWQRKKCSSNALTFGRVDSLGRYERNFEALSVERRKWPTLGSGRFKNAVRKFANLPEDGLQEEIAWRVAEMIIKDVTNITLADLPTFVRNDSHK